MRLSKTTSYAIRILVDCAIADGNLVKVAEISERRDITLQNTFKIVHLLSRAGFLQAVRGRHGGVRLARPAQDIRIGDVVRAMETMHLELEGEVVKDDTPGTLDQLFDNALEAFITVLDGHTLADMVKGTRVEPVAPREQTVDKKPIIKAAKVSRTSKSKPSSKALHTRPAHTLRRESLDR